ncbi:hypothetical protein V7968_39015 [Nocardia vulneris]
MPGRSRRIAHKFVHRARIRVPRADSRAARGFADELVRGMRIGARD